MKEFKNTNVRFNGYQIVSGDDVKINGQSIDDFVQNVLSSVNMNSGKHTTIKKRIVVKRNKNGEMTTIESSSNDINLPGFNLGGFGTQTKKKCEYCGSEYYNDINVCEACGSRDFE